MSFGFGLPLDVVIEEHRTVYNFFFAALSLIFGNSIAISFLMSISRSIFSKKNNKRHRIINDQAFLNFSFMSWFGKIALMMGIFSIWWVDFQYLPVLGIPMILLIITLYLETWKTIILVLPKKKYKILLLHFLIIAVLVTGLAQINILDYKKMDQSLLTQRPVYDLPRSYFSQNENYQRYPMIRLKLVENKENIVFIQGEDNIKFPLSKLSEIINAEKKYIRQELLPRTTTKLTANRKIDLKVIKKVEAEIVANGVYKVLYDLHHDDRYYSRLNYVTLTKRLHYSDIKFRDSTAAIISPSPPSPFSWPRFDNEKEYDTLRIKVNNTYSVDGMKIPKVKLIRYLKNRINAETIFEYHYAEQTSYQEYITLLSAHAKAADELRKENQIKFKEYGTNVREARNRLRYEEFEKYREELSKLKSKYPINVIEEFD